MPTYLIEVPHSDKKLECTQAIQVFLNSGSHFLKNADWGCMDGVHKAWMVVDVGNKEEALRILPPLYRRKANIIALKKYTMDEMVQDALIHKE
jgi:hypothetical protein